MLACSVRLNGMMAASRPSARAAQPCAVAGVQCAALCSQYRPSRTQDAHDDEFQGVSAGKSGRRQDFTVRAGTGLAAALEARGASAVEARCGGQLVDAIVHAGGDTGVVYVSSRELSLMPCASASAGRGRGSAGGLKGWMKCAAGKQKAGEDADGGSVSAEESWQSTKARIDALKAFPRAVLVVERARECDQGRTVALQVLFSRHVRCRLPTHQRARARLSRMSRACG